MSFPLLLLAAEVAALLAWAVGVRVDALLGNPRTPYGIWQLLGVDTGLGLLLALVIWWAT